MDDLLREFLAETFENLEVAGAELVRFEKDPKDKVALDRIFRLVHTVKGTCGFLALSRLEVLAHAGETLLGMFRDGSIEVSAASVSLVLMSIDRIKEILAGLETTGTEPAGDDNDLISALEAAAIGETLDATLGFAASVAREIEEAASAPVLESAALPQQSLRLNIDLLDRMMTLVGELVLTRNQLLQILRAAPESAFKVPLQRLSGITFELQDSVMRTRMQPIGTAWSKLPRIVRDLELELAKKIDLEMIGAETELDRQVLELIRDPLVHMVRNAADHGIEPPQERKAAGKSERGCIRLNAYHDGGHIVIEIGDDGRGLNPDRLRTEVVKRGLAGEAEAQHLADHELAQFIFHPGFSTADKVSSVSGRGVGMDVVRSNVEEIGGTIDLSFKRGEGTLISIKIPLTLSIISALIISVGGQRYALPQIAVTELVRARPDGEHQIELINEAPILRLRGGLLPLAHLADVLKIEESGPRSFESESYIVVLEVAGKRCGIVVDAICDTEEIVVKPAASILREITVFSGNTILGDGSVVMIIDPRGVAAAVGHQVAEESQPAQVADDMDRSGKTSLLIFRAGSEGPKAVPLALVTRIEEVPASAIEHRELRPVLQYRDGLMPILPADPALVLKHTGRQALIVVSEAGRSIGLAVDEILDVAEETLELELTSRQRGTLGTATVSGRATEILDIGAYLVDARAAWIGEAGAKGRALLVVDAGPFADAMLVPLLSAAGYEVTRARSASDALQLKQNGARFDVILSDADLAGGEGGSFVAAIRSSPEWRTARLIALTSTLGDEMRVRNTGFDECVSRHDRERLLSALRETLAGEVA